MKLNVTLKGHAPKFDDVVRNRAVEVLKRMESEFSQLQVEVSDGGTSRKAKDAKAGKDG